MSVWIALGIVLSACTYLASFISNLIVVSEYARPYIRFNRLKKHGECDDHCQNLAKGVTIYLFRPIVILVVSHILNALIFYFKFKKEDGPYRAAQFLPLIHLWRLVNLVYRSLSCKGIENLRSTYMIGLFNILSTATEGLPMLATQFTGYIVLSREHILPPMSVIFKISVATSLVSAGYNGGSSVLSIADNATSFSSMLKVATCSGLFTVFASLARCLTYINLAVYISDHLNNFRAPESWSKFYGTNFMGSVFICYWIYFWLLLRPASLANNARKYKKCLTSLVFAIVSSVVGPLYPMVSEARDNGTLGTSEFQAQLFIVATIGITLDMVVLLVGFLMAALPTANVVVSLVTALGYVMTSMWYIFTDSLCGPISKYESAVRSSFPA